MHFIHELSFFNVKTIYKCYNILKYNKENKNDFIKYLIHKYS